MARATQSETAHWIVFYCYGVDYARKVYFTAPVKLYDDTPHGAYAIGAAGTVRRAKQDSGLHPSTPSKLLTVTPHDWSDTLDPG